MISSAEFSHLFPFGIRLNADLEILFLGRSLEKRLRPPSGAHFTEFFEILRVSKAVSADFLSSTSDSPIQLSVKGSSLTLVGQFAKIADGFIFLGSPKIDSVNDLAPLGLQIDDFAPHDAVMTSLFHLQRIEIVADESVASAQGLATQQQIYRQIVEQSNDLIVALSPEGLVTLANPRAVEMLPIQIGESHAADILPPKAQLTWLAAASSLREGDRAAWVELTLVGRDGVEVLVEGHLVLSLATVEHRSVLGFLRDVTARKFAERELFASNEKLKEAQKLEAIGRFAGGIAHDFNNLLGVVSGAASLLQEELEASDPRRSDVDLILSSAEKGAALTRQILQFSDRSPTAKGSTDLVSQTMSLRSVLKRILGPGIQLKLSACVERLTVELAPIQYEQILLNLAVNAGYAMPSGGVLEISIDATDDGIHGRFEVRDSGSGMSAEVAQHIFEPFFSTKPTGSGSGLGLSVVYGIIDEAQGEILVESEPGVGTRFMVSLPLSRDQPLKERKRGGLPPAAERISGVKRVVLLEDLPELRRLILRALGRMGLTVVGFDSIEATRRGFESYDGIPDIFITDVSLPDGNGLDLAEALTQEGRIQSVVVTTGNADFERIKGLIHQYGWHILMKPFRMGQLDELVQSILRDDSHPG